MSIYTQQASLSLGFVQQIMRNTSILPKDITTIICLTATKFKPHILCVKLHFVICCEHLHFNYFIWPLPAACIVLNQNRIIKEFWKLCTNFRPVCALINYQLCGWLCFENYAITKDGCPPRIPMRYRHRSLWT